MSDAVVRHDQPPVSDFYPRKTVRRIPLLPHQLTERITPTGDVFVLAHVGVPHARAEEWWIDIVGLVARPRRLSLADLMKMPKRTVTALHQCAGFPARPEIATRRYANVVWGGADLAAVLRECEPSDEATHLWSFGVDRGSFEDVDSPVYLKDLPLSRIPAGDILLAYECNGQPLDAEHGFPVRLLVPGFYGTNSVKWLYRLELANRRPDAPFTSKYYNDSMSDGGSVRTRPVWSLAPESVIVAPCDGQTVAQGPLDVWGWAWADGPVSRVEISADGENWAEAKVEPRSQWSWQKFRYAWIAEQPGRYKLMSRAVDSCGRIQPLSGARNSAYEVNLSVV